MAGHRIPGPAGNHREGQTPDSGTLCRQLSAAPGTVKAAHGAKSSPRASARAAPQPPLLRHGNRGTPVELLQSLLNVAGETGTPLAIDGIFGDRTRDAVVAFQKSHKLGGDALVGPRTWGALFKCAARPDAPPDSVAQWPLDRKLGSVARRMLVKLPGALAGELAAALSPHNLAQLLALLVASHLFGIGEIIDLILILTIGLSALHDLLRALKTAAFAVSEQDLDVAATQLSRVVIAVGVIGFVKAVSSLRKAKGTASGAKPAAKPPPNPEAPSANRPFREISGKKANELPVASNPSFSGSMRPTGTKAAASEAVVDAQTNGGTVTNSNGAANAAQYQLLKNQLAAEEIAAGHAFDKHVLKQGEFPGIGSRAEFQLLVEDVLNNPTSVRQLSKGRTAYWQEASGIVVIRNPAAADGSTAFRPVSGRAYFEGLK